jgi:hypothetical protein
MLPHGVGAISTLAATCVPVPATSVNGWDVDVWEMTAAEVDLAVNIYKAVISADVNPNDAIFAAMKAQGVDIANVLTAPGTGLDMVTRSDIAELAAAASMVAIDGCAPDRMHMPNIPKMARRRSDSGVDIFDVDIVAGSTSPAIDPGEFLRIGSVKHLTTTNASGLRGHIAKSLSSTDELTPAYLGQQLRVLHGNLLKEGHSTTDANRVLLFYLNFPKSSEVRLHGVAVVEPGVKHKLLAQMVNLPTVTTPHRFRIVTFPGLSTIHTRCP